MAKQNFDDFLTIFTRHTVWQTTGDSLTISWQQTTKITDFTRLLEAKKHKYILYRHQAPSSFFTGKIDSWSKTSSPPANGRGPLRSQAGGRRQHQEVSCSFLIFGSFGPWMNWTWSEIVCQRRHPRDWRANSRT